MKPVCLTFADIRLERAAWKLGPVNVEISAAETTAIIGASGSGKSTLLRLAADLEAPTTGVIRRADWMTQLPWCSMVFQDYILYPHLTIRENALLRSSSSRGGPREHELVRLATALGLDDLLARLPRHLSGGERQRAAILKTLVSGAPLWLLDEPLSNLDGPSRIHVRALVREEARHRGATVLWVTHDVSEALTVADHLIVLRAGRVLQHDRVPGVLDAPATIDIARLLFGPRLSEVPGRVAQRGGEIVFETGAGSVIPIAAPVERAGDGIAVFDASAVTVVADNAPSRPFTFTGRIELIEYTPREKLYRLRGDASADVRLAVPPGRSLPEQPCVSVDVALVRVYRASDGTFLGALEARAQAETE